VKNKLVNYLPLWHNSGMEPYGQYCPVARAAEIFADRWTPLIIRELLADIHRFNHLERSLPGISRPLLVERLRRLEHAGVIEHRETEDGQPLGYYLTPAGQELKQVIESIGNWGARWALGDPRPEELDPGLLLWGMRRRVNLDFLPHRRVVVRFDFRGTKKPRIHWLVLERHEVSVCLTDPGFDVDLLVTADLAAFHKVWLGRIALGDAMNEGLVQIDGPPVLARAFPRWLQWSPFADAVRAAAIHPPVPKHNSGMHIAR
jgi:DNA-binding HxlR family transcriptional regulator